MGFFSSFGRIFLLVFNVIFLLLGVALLAIGLIFRFGPDLLLDSDVFEDEIAPLLREVDVTVSGNLIDLLKNLNIVVIAIGAIIFVLGFLGFYGACCKIKCFLVTYAVCVALILLGQIALVVLFILVQKDVETTLQTGFKQQLHSYKTDITTKPADEMSTAFNQLFQQFECCGITNYTDMRNTTWYNDQPTTPKLAFPMACCVHPNTTSADCEKNGQNYKNEGCYDAMKSAIDKFSVPLIGIGSGLLVFELLCVIFACCLCAHRDKEGVI